MIRIPTRACLAAGGTPRLLDEYDPTWRLNVWIVVWNVVGIVLIVWALAIEVLFVNAWIKQPQRPKARVGTIVVLLADIGCFFANAAPGGIIPTVLVTISAYRTYRRWDRKFWDPSHPQFVGWPR